jgi:hypothetical protein
VADWTWAKNDNQHGTLYKNAFGMDLFSESYVVVCGRTGLLDATEKSRLNWRSENTAIASRPIRFWTYDDLYTNTSATLDAWRAIRAEAGR